MSPKIKNSILLATIAAAMAVGQLIIAKEKEIMPEKNNYPAKIEISIGQTGDSLEAKYGVIVEGNKKNIGLNFYDIDPDANGKTTVFVVKTGKMSTTISNSMSITATEDRDRKVGINRLLITAKVNNGGMQPHPVAHQYVLNLIQSLRKTGWQYRIYATDPRLKGQAALNHFKQKNIDPDFPLSFQQWMALQAPLIWKFYADHTYLTLRVDRDVNHLDHAKPGAYFISLTFTPREETERLEVDEKDRDHWRDTWVERYRKFRAERNIEEAKLRAQGVPINTDYQDPPLPPPPAGQQNPVVPDDLK